MKLNLTRDEALEILDGDETKFKIVKDKIIGQGRWSTQHELIIKSIKEEKYYRAYYSRGSTEMQDESPWEYNEPDFREVIPVEKKITVFEEVK